MQKHFPFELTELKSSNVPMATVQRGDVVKIADSDLDFLRDFYNEHYDGQPITLFSNRFAIAVVNDIEGSPTKRDVMIFLVRAICDGKFIQVDMYQKTVGDRVLWTEVLDNSKPMKKVEQGYYMESYSVHREGGLMDYVTSEESFVVTYISDVVHYVIFFMQKNLNNPQYVVKKTDTHVEPGKPAKKGKKKPQKKTVRATTYVPKRITVTYDATETKPNAEEEGQKPDEEREKRIYTGHTEEWIARGHKRRIVSKDGTVRYVDVKPSVRKRNPKLMEKGLEHGHDIKLRTKQ
ncbi:MAG: hypothetical protein IKE91_03130 [Clostridia bacterium]|nr:hypothetical protein [Clostridia bacterium]